VEKAGTIMAKPGQPIPPEGVAALRQLLQLGAEGIERLCQAIQDLGPSFARADVRAGLLRRAGADIASADQLESILGEALGPLQALRYRFGFTSAAFYDLVSEWLKQLTREDWSQEYADKWLNLKQAIIKLLDLEAFSIEARARSLLEARGNWVQNLMIFADLRPVFDETAEVLGAMLIVNTLCVQYRSGTELQTAYFALDPSDLDELDAQIELARKANLRLRQQLDRDRIPPLMLEDDDAQSDSDTEKAQ
jgi:hypothetical protein